jgi:hypothetical protein
MVFTGIWIAPNNGCDFATGPEVAAEGVETEAHATYLRKNHCDPSGLRFCPPYAIR